MFYGVFILANPTPETENVAMDVNGTDSDCSQSGLCMSRSTDPIRRDVAKF